MNVITNADIMSAYKYIKKDGQVDGLTNFPDVVHALKADEECQYVWGSDSIMKVPKGSWILAENDNDFPRLLDDEFFHKLYAFDRQQMDLIFDDIIKDAFGDQDAPDPDDYCAEEVIKCQCGQHMISVWGGGNNDGKIEMAFWNFGHEGSKTSWTQRLRQIWQIITRGHPHADMVVLNSAEQLRLIRFMDVARSLTAQYKDARRDYERKNIPKEKTHYTLEEVVDMEANHVAEQHELLATIETLTKKLRSNN
jgi:hypothetical protein